MFLGFGVGTIVVGGSGATTAPIRIGTSIERGGWERSSDVWMLFEDDQARLDHPSHVGTINNLGCWYSKLGVTSAATCFPSIIVLAFAHRNIFYPTT